MLRLVNGPRPFLLLSGAVAAVGGFMEVDRYETNSLISVEGYSRILLSKESYGAILPQSDQPFRFWLQEKQQQRNIISVEPKGDLGYEVILSNPHPSAHVSTVSYKVGRGRLWREALRQ